MILINHTEESLKRYMLGYMPPRTRDHMKNQHHSYYRVLTTNVY